MSHDYAILGRWSETVGAVSAPPCISVIPSMHIGSCITCGVCIGFLRAFSTSGYEKVIFLGETSAELDKRL